MKIAVVGAGVVGGILGACLLRKGEDVALVDASPRRLDCLRAAGVVVRDPRKCFGGDFTAKPGKLLGCVEDLKDFAPDAVFVSVKACVLKKILPALKAVCGEKTGVVSYQNGLDTEEVIAEHFGAKKGVLRVVINYAGEIREDGSIEATFFNKPNFIGVLDESAAGLARELAAVLSAAGLDTEYSAAIKAQVWEKVLLNSAMSPLCALTGLTMKDVMDSPPLKSVAHGIIAEGIAAAKAGGVEFKNGFLDHCMGYLGKAGRHKPSMLADVEAGRETEIDFLNGMIFKVAGRRGVPVPQNEAITALIKGLETTLKMGKSK